MQALYDFLPILAFFATFKFADIYAATAVLMVALVIVAGLQWVKRRSVSPMLLVSAGLALVFGGLTLYFHNQLFIMWKPTIADGLFAVAFLVSPFVGEEPLIQKMMGHVLKTDRRTWLIANTVWALFFLLAAAVNLVFVYRFSVDAWANWKFASLFVMAAFALCVSVWLASRAQPVDS